MLTHRGFSAWITTGAENEPLPEYLIAKDETLHRVSCWIPCDEGQTFTVWWKDHGSKVDSCAFITLDGFTVPGRFLFGSGVTNRQGVRTGLTSERPFTFARIPDDVPVSDPQEGAGMVKLRVKQIQRTGGRAANALYDDKIPEPSTSKTVGDMRVQFGVEENAKPQYHQTWSCRPHFTDRPGLDKPSTYVTFIFRYRSAGYLRSQGIMTGPPMPMEVASSSAILTSATPPSAARSSAQAPPVQPQVGVNPGLHSHQVARTPVAHSPSVPSPFASTSPLVGTPSVHASAAPSPITYTHIARQFQLPIASPIAITSPSPAPGTPNPECQSPETQVGSPSSGPHRTARLHLPSHASTTLGIGVPSTRQRRPIMAGERRPSSRASLPWRSFSGGSGQQEKEESITPTDNSRFLDEFEHDENYPDGLDPDFDYANAE